MTNLSSWFLSCFLSSLIFLQSNKASQFTVKNSLPCPWETFHMCIIMTKRRCDHCSWIIRETLDHSPWNITGTGDHCPCNIRETVSKMCFMHSCKTVTVISVSCNITRITEYLITGNSIIRTVNMLNSFTGMVTYI